jgi:hypothetical protein
VGPNRTGSQDGRRARDVFPRWPTPPRTPHPVLPEVVSHCRTCARLCAALAEDEGPGEEASEALGDCALTCGALVQLLTMGTSMDRRAALRTCADDCRLAAEACRARGWDARWAECDEACRACAALCAHQSDALAT